MKSLALPRTASASSASTSASPPPAVERGLLRRILPEWSMPTVTIWCITPGRRLIPSRTTAFIELLRAALAGER